MSRRTGSGPSDPSCAPAVVLVIAACGARPPPPTPHDAIAASSSPTRHRQPKPGRSTPRRSPVRRRPDPAPSLPAGVTVDPGLLEVLPARSRASTWSPDPDTAAEVAADPLLAESALTIAVALAVGAHVDRRMTWPSRASSGSGRTCSTSVLPGVAGYLQRGGLRGRRRRRVGDGDPDRRSRVLHWRLRRRCADVSHLARGPGLHRLGHRRPGSRTSASRSSPGSGSLPDDLGAR